MPSLKIQVKAFYLVQLSNFFYKTRPTHPKETSVKCLPVTNKFFRINSQNNKFINQAHIH